MKKQIIITAVLVVAIVGFLVGGILLMQADQRQEAAIAAAQEQLDRLSADVTALENTLAGLTTDNADSISAEPQHIQQKTTEHQGQLDDLQKQIIVDECQFLTEKQIDELQAYLDENKEAIDLVMEEVTYLQGVYDELKIGLEQVNGYLAEG